MPEKEEETDRRLMAEGYHRVFRFEDLGGTKDKSNFIAVVHIDGNAMGKRVEKLQRRFEKLDWTEYKEKLREFSASIDEDFKAAYKDMSDDVASNIGRGRLSDLNITDNKFPVRRIITAGDDICFVAEGRIGVECAAVFIACLAADGIKWTKKDTQPVPEWRSYIRNIHFIKHMNWQRCSAAMQKNMG